MGNLKILNAEKGVVFLKTFGLGTSDSPFVLGAVTRAAEKSLSYAVGTAAASGDNTLVAAPGVGDQLVVTAFVIQGLSVTATTMLLKSGATTCWRVLAQNQGDSLSIVFPPGQGWRLAENEALILDLSGANSCGYSVQYYTEPLRYEGSLDFSVDTNSEHLGSG